MSEASLPLGTDIEVPEEEIKKGQSTLTRILRYSLVRLFTLFITVLIGVYLTILIANMGGYVDEIRRGQIQEQVAMFVSMDQGNQQLTTQERNELINQQTAIMEARFGLDQPFAVRSFRYLQQAMTLNLGLADQMTSDSGSRQVRLIILERLPATLLLFGTAQLLVFFSALFLALGLSRKYGSFLDKAIIALAPSSAAPAWFYGIFLIVIFAGVLQILPFGGMIDAPRPEQPIPFLLSLGKHMILPLMAWMMSSIFLSTYSWRTFFLIYSSEDYVDLAKAKGLPDKMVERRYILRPTLPTIITSFALLVIAMWTGAIITETIFNWPGLGRLLFQAISVYDTPVIVASTVIYAYLLALTVFMLDFLYALVDPRVKVGEGAATR